ncbi:MAG: serine hydrolase [Vulcanimicrobiaceae bacterium]
MNDTSGLHRCCAILAAVASLLASSTGIACAYGAPQPLIELRADVRHLASRLPASSAVEVMDLSTGYSAGYNETESMPAASTIKIPVMVEVFKQLEAGRFNLEHRVTLLASDKDYGSGELCDMPVDTTYPVSELLEKMIDISDNTAANMLIRLVGRQRINRTMVALGLRHTRLMNYVRTDSWSVRQQLRSSPSDMVRLLELMAKHRLVDSWSSGEMISILEQDEYNTLLPEPLPDDVPIAHKTGSFFDTLDDVGIVYASEAPYVIAVYTTGLPSRTVGRTFFHRLSSDAYRDEQRLAVWRASVGIDTFAVDDSVTAHEFPSDVRYWQSGDAIDAAGG